MTYEILMQAVGNEVALPPLPLDPFGFIPGVASRITGIGGNAPGHDPTYAFHTPYVEAAAGQCRFTLRFHGLTARRGVLQLRVHIIPWEEGAHARIANSERIQLNRLVQAGGEASIGFEGFGGFGFAVLGLIADDTDAEAAGLEVTLDRPAHGGRAGDPVPEGRTSTYGRDTARPATHLISIEPPTLADPVSQLGTRAQLRETAFHSWSKRLTPPAGEDVAAWSDAYVMQVLSRYGVLAEGARGLGFMGATSPLPGAVAAAGVKVTVAGVSEFQVERERGDAFKFRTIDPVALPKDLIDFDFLWSIGLCAGAGSAAAVLGLLEGTMSCLRPGGLAVHVVPFDIAADGDRTNGGEILLARVHLERLALNLISRNNEVAQIKIGRDGALLRADLPDDEVGAFGVIARRPAAIV